MLKIQPSRYQLSTFKQGDKVFIQCALRNKPIELTPEEFIRQILIQYLIEDQSISKSAIAIEKSFMVNQRLKRFDLVIYDKKGNPWMLIECKQPSVDLEENVELQASNYNKIIKAPYIWLSNGADNKIYDLEKGSTLMEGFPSFPD